MKSTLVQVADIGVTFYSTCTLYLSGIEGESNGKKIDGHPDVGNDHDRFRVL